MDDQCHSKVPVNNKLGLIGNPLAGSKSPEIHKLSLELNGIEGSYQLFETLQLKEQFNRLKSQGYVGINVTLPYKEAIIESLDELDETARAMGAVNTILIEQGKSKGFNTDGDGFVKALTLNGYAVMGKSILVIGSGGAARGICYALLQAGAEKLWVTNRTHSKAMALAQTFSSVNGDWQIEAVFLDQTNALQPDIVINTTSVGMLPFAEDMPINPGQFSSKTLICDIVYKPHETRFLKEARRQGHLVVYGLDMLICQALLAEKIWFGDAIDLPNTLHVLKNKLLEAVNTE